MIDKFLKNYKKRKKLKEKAQKRYDSLNLLERDAYEQIIKRNRPNLFYLSIPTEVIKIILIIGGFFVMTCYIMGLDISPFRESFRLIVLLLFKVILILIPVGFIFHILDLIKLNRLKLKLLTK